MLLNVRVGGGASPTQSALPHSFLPTQVFRSITLFSSQLLISRLYSQRVLKQWLGVNQQSISDLWCTISHTLYNMCISAIVGLKCAEHKTRVCISLWSITGSEPIPHFSQSREEIEASLFNWAWEAANRCLSVHAQGMPRPPHTHEKLWKSLCCIFSVLRQCLSLAGWRKQSHRFLILIPFYYLSPIDHLSILNEMEG